MFAALSTAVGCTETRFTLFKLWSFGWAMMDRMARKTPSMEALGRVAARIVSRLEKKKGWSREAPAKSIQGGRQTSAERNTPSREPLCPRTPGG